MTSDEKILKIKELEGEFLMQIETIKTDYQKQIKQILDEVNKKKIEDLKKDLGI
jgi:hypothetical protein